MLPQSDDDPVEAAAAIVNAVACVGHSMCARAPSSAGGLAVRSTVLFFVAAVAALASTFGDIGASVSAAVAGLARPIGNAIQCGLAMHAAHSAAAPPAPPAVPLPPPPVAPLPAPPAIALPPPPVAPPVAPRRWVLRVLRLPPPPPVFDGSDPLLYEVLVVCFLLFNIIKKKKTRTILHTGVPQRSTRC